MLKHCQLYALTALVLVTIGSPASSEARGESVQTIRGKDAPKQSIKSPLELPLTQVLAETTLRSAIEEHLLKARRKGLSPQSPIPYHCEVYIKDDGTFGDIGKIATQVLEDEKFKTLLGSLEQSDVAKLCPNFPRMTKSQRAGFWIWTMAGIEWDETLCGTTRMSLQNLGQPKLTGRLHLPSSEKYGGNCTDNGTDLRQIQCAYRFVLQGLNRTDGMAILDRRAYYEIQRPRHPLHGAFRSYLAAYPVCGNK